MRQSMTGINICRLCDASYESDTKLQEHQRMVHRGHGTEERPEDAAIVEPSEAPDV
jgi:hypothetical protein